MTIDRETPAVVTLDACDLRRFVCASRVRRPAVVLAVAVAVQVEIWAMPVAGPKLAIVPGMLLATLPLLLRGRFPLAAPACVFARRSPACPSPIETRSQRAQSRCSSRSFSPSGRSERATSDTRSSREWQSDSQPSRSSRRARGRTWSWRSGAEESTRSPSAWSEVGSPSAPSLSNGGRSARASSRSEPRGSSERAKNGRAPRSPRSGPHRARAPRRDRPHVSVMTVQAGAARLLLDEEPERAREPAARRRGDRAGRRSPRCAACSGSCASDESEAALAPQPGLADLDALVEQVRGGRAAGRARDRGRAEAAGAGGRPRRVPDRAGGADERASSTPARTRAGDRPLRARRARARDRERRRAHRQTARRRGHGLVGMRERVALYGGELEAGRASGRRLRRPRAAAARDGRRDPRPDRRRPGARARRLPHDPRRPERTSRSSARPPTAREALEQARDARARRRAHGHPHARARRARGDAPARWRTRRRDRAS